MQHVLPRNRAREARRGRCETQRREGRGLRGLPAVRHAWSGRLSAERVSAAGCGNPQGARWATWVSRCPVSRVDGERGGLEHPIHRKRWVRGLGNTQASAAHGLGGYPQSARRELRLRVVPAASARGIPEVRASAWSGRLSAECAARGLGGYPQSARGEHPHAVHGAWSGRLSAEGAAPGLGGYPQRARRVVWGVTPQSAQARGLGGYPKSARCRVGWLKEVTKVAT